MGRGQGDGDIGTRVCEVERDSTFTLTCDLSFIASILFANVNFTHVRMEKLRDSGDQP